MAQHVRPDATELCGLASDPHDIIDGLAGELCLPLGHEQPGQLVLPGGEVALDRAQLIAGDRVLDAQAALRRATLDRLTSSWLRRIWMASLTRKPCR